MPAIDEYLKALEKLLETLPSALSIKSQIILYNNHNITFIW